MISIVFILMLGGAALSVAGLVLAFLYMDGSGPFPLPNGGWLAASATGLVIALASCFMLIGRAIL